MTKLSVVHSAIADLDPKGENPDISMALYIVSIARGKEYSDMADLVEDAHIEHLKDYGYRLDE